MKETGTLKKYSSKRKKKEEEINPSPSSGKCYFCGEDTVRFHEHYFFCPECSAIYTYLIVWSSKCSHIKEGIPTVLREPWYADLRNKKAYIKDEKCSICHKECVADGW